MSELAEIIAEAQKKEEPKKPQPWWAMLLIAAVPCAITGYFSLRQTIVESAAAEAKNAAGYAALRDAIKELQSHDVENGKTLVGLNASFKTMELWVQSIRTTDVQHAELQLKHGTQLAHMAFKASPPMPMLHALAPSKPTVVVPNNLNEALAQQKNFEAHAAAMEKTAMPAPSPEVTAPAETDSPR